MAAGCRYGAGESQGFCNCGGSPEGAYGELEMDITNFLAVMQDDKVVYLLSFFLAVSLAIFPGNWVVRVIHGQVFEKVRSSEESKRFIELEFKSTGAKWIGQAERTIYIFGIMFGQPGVITGVIILKAFFNWTDKFLASVPPDNARVDLRRQNYVDMISNYHVYLAGNLISIIVGLTLGELGIFLFPKIIRLYLDIGCAKLCNL
jgi:hypothetical protein